MQRGYNRITKDTGDAKWMQEACRHFHTGCKACIVDAPQTASSSFHPAVSVDDSMYWMQEMPEGCIIASSDLNIPAIRLAYI